jgi:DNA-binding PadR family transcriptional regulator
VPSQRRHIALTSLFGWIFNSNLQSLNEKEQKNAKVEQEPKKREKEASTAALQKRQEVDRDVTLTDALERVLDVKLLYLIYKGPATGYELRRRMAEQFHSRVSFGTLYPHLRNFEEERLVLGTWRAGTGTAPRKKTYAITEKGLATLRKCLSELVALGREMDL